MSFKSTDKWIEYFLKGPKMLGLIKMETGTIEENTGNDHDS